MISATVHRSAGFNTYGDPNESTETIEVSLMGVAPRTGEPGTSSQDVLSRGREGVSEGTTAYAAVGTDLRHDDIVVIHEGPYAGRWQVDGTPGTWTNTPYTGWQAGIEIALNRREG